MIKPGRIRNTVLVLCAMTAAVSVAAYSYLYRGTSVRIDETVAAKKIVKAAESAKTLGKEIVRLHDATIHERAQLASLLVSDDQSVEVIQALEAVGPATKTEISISTIRSAKPDEKADPKIGSVSANVSASGSWAGVMKALKMFENLPYENSISQVNMRLVSAGDDKSKKPRTWEAAVEISFKTLVK